MPSGSEALALGDRVEIGFGDDVLRWFPTRVEDADGDGRIVVAWPTDSERRLVAVSAGDNLEVAVAKSDAMYSARAAVQHAATGTVPHLELIVSGPWRRTQRRNAVRARVAIRPRLASIVYGEVRKPLRLGITNLSANGLQVRSQDELRRGDLLELIFDLPGFEADISVQGRVMRVHRHERVWEAGCELEGVPDRLAQRIFQFIFAQQRAIARARQA